MHYNMFYPNYSDNFRERKQARSDYYHKFIKGWKLVNCSACSGGGYYCGGKCASCNGTGRERAKVSVGDKSNF